MQSDFSPAYARHLGFKDGREYGHKHPHRSFEAGKSARDNAYFEGLKEGVAVSVAQGLDARCTVHWDNPGFHTPSCGQKATHLATWEQGSGNTAVLWLCDKHAAVARELHEPAKPRHWAVVPVGWL